MAAAADRQMSCLFVRFNTTLFFTFVRSLGTLTNAINLHARGCYPLQAAPSSGCSFPLFSCNFSISRELSTSFPHTSHPGDCCLANSSIRGRSPINFTMRFLASAGFLLCSTSISYHLLRSILYYEADGATLLAAGWEKLQFQRLACRVFQQHVADVPTYPAAGVWPRSNGVRGTSAPFSLG